MAYGSRSFVDEMLRLPPLPERTVRPSSQWIRRNPEQAKAMGYGSMEEEAAPMRPQALPRGGTLQEELPTRPTPQDQIDLEVQRKKALWEAGAPEREYERQEADRRAAAAKQDAYEKWRQGERDWLRDTENDARDAADRDAAWRAHAARTGQVMTDAEIRARVAAGDRPPVPDAPGETPEERVKRLEAEAAARARGTASAQPPAESPENRIKRLEAEAAARARGTASGTPVAQPRTSVSVHTDPRGRESTTRTTSGVRPDVHTDAAGTSVRVDPQQLEAVKQRARDVIANPDSPPELKQYAEEFLRNNP